MNPQTLAYIQAQLQGFQTETCDIYAPAIAVDETGARTMQLVKVASGVKCRVIYAMRINYSGVREIGEREQMKSENRISLPPATTLGIDYEIVVGDVRYSVVRISETLTDKADVQAVITRRRDA